ncbi:hypothetical protein [Tuberibacillus sp. Marseille-P3662]|uniref:hypothetical protein n=1 Tax=Tuberibacillus sp. Marseille-P3662 TaxID=1965358 RepID=UPI000A1CD3A1|nr:hypothetical protein [Tuberibacillus sp. Marseille-P3662]
MKNIVSFKLDPSQMALQNVLELYHTCCDANNDIYLYKDGKTKKITRVTELLAFILTSRHRRLLVIIEGQQAKHTMKHVVSRLFSGQNPEQVV